MMASLAARCPPPVSEKRKVIWGLLVGRLVHGIPPVK